MGRAVLLLVVAIVAGVLVLQVASRPISHRATVAATTTTTTVPGHPGTTATTAVKPTPAVKVLVANGSGVTGAAHYFSTQLKSAGWSMLTPTTASPVTATTVYYAAGDSKWADDIAGKFGLKPTAVHPYSSSVGVSGATQAGVLVIVGPDLSAQIPASTTTTAAATTTTTATTTTAPA